jgi:hypothetical protein
MVQPIPPPSRRKRAWVGPEARELLVGAAAEEKLAVPLPGRDLDDGLAPSSPGDVDGVEERLLLEEAIDLLRPSSCA